MAGLVSAMKLRPDVVGVACEALHNLFSTGEVAATAFVDQGLKANVIPFLLSLLGSTLDAKVQKPASTKAQIVVCLKTMAASPQHSEEASLNYFLPFCIVQAKTTHRLIVFTHGVLEY